MHILHSQVKRCCTSIHLDLNRLILARPAPVLTLNNTDRSFPLYPPNAVLIVKHCSEGECYQTPWGALPTYSSLSPNTRAADSIGSKWGPRSCIFKEVPGNSEAWPGSVNAGLVCVPGLLWKQGPELDAELGFLCLLRISHT